MERYNGWEDPEWREYWGTDDEDSSDESYIDEGTGDEAEAKWDAFVDHMCKTNEFYPDDPSELTDDDYEDLKEEYKWYSREH